MSLSANTPRAAELGILNDLPVAAGVHIYEGAAVSVNASGFAKPLAAGEDFVGFADCEADNTSGSAGAIFVSVRHKGKVVLAVTGAAAANVNDAVYASADDTFTLTATSNSLIGYLRRYDSAGCVVELQVKNG